MMGGGVSLSTYLEILFGSEFLDLSQQSLPETLPFLSYTFFFFFFPSGVTCSHARMRMTPQERKSLGDVNGKVEVERSQSSCTRYQKSLSFTSSFSGVFLQAVSNYSKPLCTRNTCSDCQKPKYFSSCLFSDP